MTVSSRALELFNQSIRNQSTFEIYHRCVNKFLEWAHKDHESLLLLPRNELQTLLEDFVFYLKKKNQKRTTVKLYLAAIARFLDVNEIECNIRRLKMFLPEEAKANGPKAWSTEQIQRMLEFADNKRTKAIINFLSASGCRVGVITELRWKNVKPISDDCYQVTVYAGSTHEYTTFLHHEARKSLDDYTEDRIKLGERLTGDCFVFTQQRTNHFSKPKPLTVYVIGTQINYLAKKAGIEREQSTNGRYDTSVGNGFRKRFNTLLKSNPNISYAICERLMDHKAYLESSYLDTSDTAKLFEEYEKAIPDLIITDSERLKVKNRDLEEENSKLNSMYTDSLSAMSDRMTELENELKELRIRKP